MLECDWVGIRTRPSMIRTACLMPSSKLPFSRWKSRLTIGALRMCSNNLSWPGKFGFDSDQVTLSALGGLDRVPFLLGDDREQVLDPDRPWRPEYP